MRLLTLVLCILLSAAPAMGQVSVGIGISVPGVNIGINVPAYPQLVRVPGYPVYYAPQLGTNLFFYDGMYWVFQDDNWYASSWYNGPWGLVAPQFVPVYVLRIPVRYYRRPPPYFRGWRPDAPPRWGDHWGHDWEEHRRGWDRWDRRFAPPPAPLPTYQRQYSGHRYPPVEEQPVLHARNYRYQPHEPVVRQHYEEHVMHAPPPHERPPEQDQRRKAHDEPPQGKGAAHDRGKGQEKDRDKEDRGQGRNK